MTDIERIRALAQTFLDEAQVQSDEAGGEDKAPADVVRVAKVCRQIIAEIALIPAVTAPDRIPPAVRKELDDYASVGARPSAFVRAVLEGDLFGLFSAAGRDRLPNTDLVLVALPAIVAHIREALHSTSYGSPKAVSRWMARPRG